jgi:predicted ATPase
MEIQDKEKQFATQNINLPDDKNFFIFVGSNNGGKSTLLRSIAKTFQDQKSYVVPVNRTLLTGEGSMKEDYKKNLPVYNSRTLQQEDDNSSRQIQPLQDFFSLKDKDREPIIEWYNKYFPNPLIEEREDVDNSASPMLLKANKYSITKQGSGMRATIEIFIRLFDPEVEYLCIDEPELGLEPYLQKYLFQAIKDKALPKKKIFIATHSHHFLDLEDPSNNYICQRNGDDKIEIKPVEQMNDVIFRLLGNTLASYLLPEKVLIFEGPSDTSFIKKILSLLGKSGFGVHNSGGNGSVKYAINSITNFLKFNEKNVPVYKDRTYVIVDNPLKDTLEREWKLLIGKDDHILTLTKDAIEYYYPERHLQSIFNSTQTRTEIVKDYLSNDPNCHNGIAISKVKLATKICELITAEDLNEADNELFSFVKRLP